MRLNSHSREDGSVEMQIAPMADIGFLLLCFFIVTSKPQKQEADISISLPGSVSDETTADIPEDLTIHINEKQQIVINDQVLSELGEVDPVALRQMLKQFREAAHANHSKSLITVDAHDQAPHQRIVDVLAICHEVGLREVTLQAENETQDEDSSWVAGL